MVSKIVNAFQILNEYEDIVYLSLKNHENCNDEIIHPDFFLFLKIGICMAVYENQTDLENYFLVTILLCLSNSYFVQCCFIST